MGTTCQPRPNPHQRRPTSPVVDFDEAKAEAKAESNRNFVEALLENRFGSVDEELAAIVESIASLPVEEYTPLLLNASRTELLDRFSAK